MEKTVLHGRGNKQSMAVWQQQILEWWENGVSDIQRAHSKGTRIMKSDTVWSGKKVSDQPRGWVLRSNYLNVQEYLKENAYFPNPNTICPWSFQETTPYLPRGSRSKSGSQLVSSFPTSFTSNPSSILTFPSKIYPKSTYFPNFTSTSTSSRYHLSWVPIIVSYLVSLISLLAFYNSPPPPSPPCSQSLPLKTNLTTSLLC